MDNILRPYFVFGGRCEEALEFYGAALGARVEFLMRYKDSLEPLPPVWFRRALKTKFSMQLSASVKIPSWRLTGGEEGLSFNGFLLSLVVPTEAEAERAFIALSTGGKVKMPLIETFWSSRYGVVTDRFGLGWKASVETLTLD